MIIIVLIIYPYLQFWNNVPTVLFRKNIKICYFYFLNLILSSNLVIFTLEQSLLKVKSLKLTFLAQIAAKTINFSFANHLKKIFHEEYFYKPCN